jgi:hypothetical protein
MSRLRVDTVSIDRTLRDLETVLRGLTPGDNFRGFYWEGTLHAGQEVEIRNKMREGTIPTHFLVCYHTPVPTITKGPTAWTKEFVYIRNATTTSDVETKVFFYGERLANE